MTRRQSRRLVRHESVITAVIGAALGLPLGVATAAIATRAMRGEDIAFSLPVVPLIASDAWHRGGWKGREKPRWAKLFAK